MFPDDAKVLVEHVMTVKKHVRPNPQRNIKGGIAEQERPDFDFERGPGMCDLRSSARSDTKCAAIAKCEFARSAGRRWTNSFGQLLANV